MDKVLKCTKKSTSCELKKKKLKMLRSLALGLREPASLRNFNQDAYEIQNQNPSKVIAQGGQNVILVDSDPELLEKAQKTIYSNLSNLAHKFHKQEATSTESFRVWGRIKISTKIEDGLKSDLIIEDVIDNLAVKQALFTKLDQETSPRTILASNPTSLSVNAIGAGVKKKNRYGGLHFFNPVPAMRLLEVIKSDHISDETYQTMLAWGKSIGKTCITCKDTPGFIVNRLLIPYGAEALRMYERGDASKEDIDIAMKLGAGYPMGPFELLDFTGLDTNKIALEHMYEMTKNPVFRPIVILNKMVEEGKLGVKSGEGFYKYKNNN